MRRLQKASFLFGVCLVVVNFGHEAAISDQYLPNYECDTWNCTGSYQGYDNSGKPIGICTLSTGQIVVCVTPSSNTCIKADNPLIVFCRGSYIDGNGVQQDCYVYWPTCTGTMPSGG